MIVRGIRDNCDGKGPQIVETEVPDPTPEEIEVRRLRREERLAKRNEGKKE